MLSWSLTREQGTKQGKATVLLFVLFLSNKNKAGTWQVSEKKCPTTVSVFGKASQF